MRRLHVFNTVSIDGYFVAANGDMGWAYRFEVAHLRQRQHRPVVRAAAVNAKP